MNRINEATRVSIEKALQFTPSQKKDIAKITHGKLFGMKMVFIPGDINRFSTLDGVSKQVDDIINKSKNGVGMLHYLAVDDLTGRYEMLSAVVKLK